jgi:hypothetical protein
MTRATPSAEPASEPGDRVPIETWPPAGWDRFATSKTMTMASSSSSSRASTRLLISTRSRPRTATTAQAASEHTHQAIVTCAFSSSRPDSISPNTPYRPTCSMLYAIRATNEAPTPTLLDAPRAMNV